MRGALAGPGLRGLPSPLTGLCESRCQVRQEPRGKFQLVLENDTLPACRCDVHRARGLPGCVEPQSRRVARGGRAGRTGQAAGGWRSDLGGGGGPGRGGGSVAREGSLQEGSVRDSGEESEVAWPACKQLNASLCAETHGVTPGPGTCVAAGLTQALLGRVREATHGCPSPSPLPPPLFKKTSGKMSPVTMNKSNRKNPPAAGGGHARAVGAGAGPVALFRRELAQRAEAWGGPGPLPAPPPPPLRTWALQATNPPRAVTGSQPG